jgi:hypothetical protein
VLGFGLRAMTLTPCVIKNVLGNTPWGYPNCAKNAKVFPVCQMFSSFVPVVPAVPKSRLGLFFKILGVLEKRGACK